MYLREVRFYEEIGVANPLRPAHHYFAGERYSWTQLVVTEFVDGRRTGLAQFELDDEAAAFAYAEERVRRAEDG